MKEKTRISKLKRSSFRNKTYDSARIIKSKNQRKTKSINVF